MHGTTRVCTSAQQRRDAHVARVTTKQYVQDHYVRVLVREVDPAAGGGGAAPPAHGHHDAAYAQAVTV